VQTDRAILRARDVAAVGIGSALILALCLIAYSRTKAPMPAAFEFLRLANLGQGLAPILSNARANVSRLIDLGDDYDPLEIVHRVEYLAMTVALGAALLLRRRPDADAGARVQFAMQWLQLTGIVLAMILLYTLTNWTELRIISPHLLLAALVLALLPGRLAPAMTAALVAVNVLATPVYLESFRQNRTDNFLWDRRSLRVFEETIDGRVRYVPGASPWCNTILSSQYPPDFIALPPGVGISITRDPHDLSSAPRSRFLLLDPRAHEAMDGSVRVQQIGSPLPYGTLYLNLNARCP
jgi:hypothetical protein